MLLIRKFEERLFDEFSKGKLLGTTHLYIGQEANAVGICDILAGNDIIFSNHRCHGHYLAYGGDPYYLVAEIMGKETGLVGGRGGSQHIQWKNFFSNGIQGGIVPIAVGMALAEKEKQTRNIALAFMGDGTFGQGVVYESFNIASLWEIPILFVVENNLYAQTTPIQCAMAGNIKDRLAAFNIRAWECNTTDVLKIREESKDAVNFVRKSRKPASLILNTYRFSSHSKGDDFRDPDEIDYYKKLDPLKIHGIRIRPDERIKADDEVESIIKEAFLHAENDAMPDSSKLDPILL